jgi:hypothetical protein
MRNYYLLLSLLSNEGTTKKNTVGRKRMMVREITNSGNIIICLEL